jgi:plasmid stabilization system protein ParE
MFSQRPRSKYTTKNTYLYECVKALGKHPEIGRLIEELPPEFREWVVEFGQGAYVAQYHYDGRQIVILAVRHGREAGY